MIYLVCIMAVYVPLLQQYLARPPCAAPSSSIALPDGLRNELEAQHLEVATDTLANGNCGIDAFGISLIEEANRNRALYCTNKYKKFLAASRIATARCAHLRSMALHWMENHADDIVWDGMSFKDLAVMMAGRVGSSTYAEVIKSVATDKEWIDCSCLLALTCYFSVDVLIFQEGMDPRILRSSLMGTTPLGMLRMAMANDYHS